MADDTVQGGYVFGARKMVGKVQADKAALFTEETDKVIGEVPSVAGDGAGVGVGRHRRHMAGHKDFPGALIVQMTGVHNHMEIFHGFHHFTALFRNASFHAIGKPDFIGIVPGESHKPHAVFVHALQLFHAAPCRFSAFHRKQGPYLSLFLRFPQILPAADGADETVPGFHFPAEGAQQILIPFPHIRRFLLVHPEGKILDEAAPFFQFLQIHIKGILQKAPLLGMIMELRYGIAVEINVFHSTAPIKSKRRRFLQPPPCRYVLVFLYHTIGRDHVQAPLHSLPSSL